LQANSWIKTNSIEDVNYGVYGNYGNVGYYGNYGNIGMDTFSGYEDVAIEQESIPSLLY
jgi:hypothetical protein